MNKKKNLTRAETIRQRKAAERAQNTQEKRILKPISLIQASKKMSFVSTKKREVTIPIQRYEANAFAPTGEGLHFLKIPKIHLEWRAASATLAILLSIALYLLFTSSYFIITAPQISGTQYLTAKEINSVLNLSGKTVFTIVPQRLERDLLLTHPGLADVEITLSLPNTVNVTVRERQPAIIWEQDGKSAWIDAEGIAFRSSAHVEGLITVTALGSPPAPIVDITTQNELAPPPYIAPEIVAALQTLVTYVPPDTPIIYNPKSGLGWVDSHGWTVQLGDITEEIGLKLHIYETMVSWFTKNYVQPVLVNLEHPHAPYYRMEP